MLIDLAAIAAIVFLAQAGAPAAAGPASPAPGASGAAATAPLPSGAAEGGAGDPVVCRSVGETNSHFTHRECHSASEWRAIADEARRETQYVQDKPAQLFTPH